MDGDPPHLGLQLVRRDGPLPVILQRLRVAQSQTIRGSKCSVTIGFAFRFHRYISLLRREPRVAVDPAGRGSGAALGEDA